MRFKLDECVDVRLTMLFEDAGHDVETVFSEKLAGAPDKSLYDICLKEKRTFVTQDLDFSNPFVFDPVPTKEWGGLKRCVCLKRSVSKGMKSKYPKKGTR